ncbi:MAG: EAL domain-containing protein [Campylobacterota bacterium]
MKTNLQILILIVLSSLLGWYSYNYYKKHESFNQTYQEYSTYLFMIEQNENRIISSIERAVIFLYFNNDKIAHELQHAQAVVNELLQKQRPKYDFFNDVYNDVKEYDDALQSYEVALYSFVKTNASIKNSINYLKNEIQSLPAFPQEYTQQMTQMISYLLRLQANFNEEIDLDQQMLQNLQSYRFDDLDLAHKHFLFISHIQLLYKEFEHYGTKYETLLSFKTRDIIKEAFSDLDTQSTKMQNSLQEEFEMIVSITFLFVLAIFVYIIIIEKNRQKIRLLQRQEKKALATDTLTHLFNRSVLKQKIKEHSHPVVIVINIIEFRNINNLVGPNGGDYVLKSLAKLVKKNFKPYGFRIGSDEFAAIVERSENDLHEELEGFVQEVENHLFVYEQIQIPVNILIGVSDIYPYVINAKAAIDTIKHDVTKKIIFYDESMNSKKLVAQNIKMLQKVKTALSEDMIVPYFQEIVELENKKPIKYEALVRLKEGENVLSPFFFLDIAKKSKHYSAITKTVMQKSIDFVKKYGHDVSINLSSEDIVDEETKNFIFHLLQKNSDIVHKITFELVESEEIKSYETVLEFTKQIKKLGAMLAIDDFGSGYSNFEYLLKFEPDILKIDGSLIKDIAVNEELYAIVKTMVNFAKGINIKTVAEFVDNEDVHQKIKELGIDYGQGYHYAKPKEFA